MEIQSNRTFWEYGAYSKSLVFLLVMVFVFTSSTFAQNSSLSSLSLNQCIQLALKNNPGFNAVEYQVRASQARTKESQSAWYPTVNLNMNVRQYPIEESGIDDRQYSIQESGISDRSYFAGINARYTLFDGLGRTNSVKAAKSAYRAEEMRKEYNQDELVYTVSKAYYRLWQAAEVVQVTEKSLERARLHLKYAKTRFETGIATKSDILKAQVEVSNAELALDRAQNEKQTAKGSLNVLLGNAAHEEISIEGVSKNIPLEGNNSLRNSNQMAERLIGLAFQKRPDLQMVEQQIKTQDASLSVVKSAYYPTLTLETNFSTYGTTFTGMEPSSSSYVGLNLNVPLFTGFKQSSKVNRESLELRRLQQELEQERNLIGEEVWNAYITVYEARERIDNTEILYDNAYENLLIAEGEYREGTGSMLDLIDAQTALADADGRRIEAQRDYYTALAKLKKVTGTDNLEEVLK